MPTHKVLPATGVRSLVWCGDELIDWAAGAACYGLDGSVARASVRYAYRFDTAVTSADGRISVLYEQHGTKCLVLDEGEVLREVNRSYYHADDYDFPICLWTTPDGRTLMAHCPESYDRIEIDDAVTGERLTASADRKPHDFFHSRLQVSPGRTRMFSAGWFWHPWDAVCVFDFSVALTNPASLDDPKPLTPQSFNVDLVEESSACWQSDDRLLVAGGSYGEDPEAAAEQEGKLRLHRNGIMVYDIPSGSCIRSIVLEAPAGVMMPIGEDHVLALYGHPRLVSLQDGSVIEEWPDLSTGDRTSSIQGKDAQPQPPLALDPENRRFAVFAEDGIHVVDCS